MKKLGYIKMVNNYLTYQSWGMGIATPVYGDIFLKTPIFYLDLIRLKGKNEEILKIDLRIISK